MTPDILQPSPHCTGPGCTSQDTVTVDGVNGRRCAAHPPQFEPEHAVRLAVIGWREAAYSYCRTDVAA
jgi:hypothetical protein